MKLRSWFLCLAAALCAITLVPIARAQLDVPASLPSDAEAVPEGLTAPDWSSIRAAYEAHRHAVVECEDGYRARNPGQQWTTYFDIRGFTIDAGGWRWGLELVRWGFEGSERTVESPAGASAEGQRFTREWDAALSEWYINDAHGVEHGYTIRERPMHDTGRAPGPLTFTLAVRGGLHGEVQGKGVCFSDGEAAILTYTGLSVYDAEGRNLPARMQCRGEELLLSIDEREAHYPLCIDPVAQQVYLKASNAGWYDYFGYSVSVSGNTVVVGAIEEDGSAVGVNGDQSDNSVNASGAAYVFVRNGTRWSQEAYLKASNTEMIDNFGWAVSVSGDTVVIGAVGEDSSATGVNGDQSDNAAPNSGAAYVFARKGTSWSQEAYLKASNSGTADHFGYSVSVSGNTIVVGAWAEDSNALGVDGDQSNNSANASGAGYVFVRSEGSWGQEAYLKASNAGADDWFGRAVAASGETVVVGAAGEASDATGINGDQSNNSALAAGAAYVFVRSGTSWSQDAYIKASNTATGCAFGWSVAVSGTTVVVGAHGESSSATGVDGNQADNGAPGSGAAFVFVYNEPNWSQEAYLKASNTGVGDQFGYSVAVSGNRLAVGAWLEDSQAMGVNGEQADNSVIDSGAAYVFARSGITWEQEAYLKASNTDWGDFFGCTVSVSGNAVVVGALGEDSSSTGVNGDQGNAPLSDYGAAYVFVETAEATFCDATDGALATCPCANPGSNTSGCDNAQATGGVSLSVLGQTTSPNGATFSGAGFSTMGVPTALIIRSNALDPASPVVFGDGLRCVNTSGLVRLAATTATGGVSTHVVGHGAMAGPGTFYYQLWYRNAPSSYCTPAAFNLSSGRTLVW